MELARQQREGTVQGSLVSEFIALNISWFSYQGQMGHLVI
jgi:hypothetical protein